MCCLNKAAINGAITLIGGIYKIINQTRIIVVKVLPIKFAICCQAVKVGFNQVGQR
jgi:hypothetical protein